MAELQPSPRVSHAGGILQELRDRFGEQALAQQPTCDGITTLWVSKDSVRDVLRYLKNEVDRPYRMLYDLTAIDERLRVNRQGQPAADMTVVYHLLSFERNEDLRVKVASPGRIPPPSEHHRHSGRRRTGTSARCGTCSASRSTAIPTSAGS